MKTIRSLTSQAGFTLAELLLISSIIVLAVGAAAPVWSTLVGNMTLRGEARRLYSELQKTRMKAVMENKRYHVETSSTAYTVCQDADKDGNCESGEPATTVDVKDSGVKLTSVDFTFFPNGSASVGAVVTLTGVKSATSQVSVSAAGRIRVD